MLISFMLIKKERSVQHIKSWRDIKILIIRMCSMKNSKRKAAFEKKRMCDAIFGRFWSFRF